MDEDGSYTAGGEEKRVTEEEAAVVVTVVVVVTTYEKGVSWKKRQVPLTRLARRKISHDISHDTPRTNASGSILGLQPMKRPDTAPLRGLPQLSVRPYYHNLTQHFMKDLRKVLPLGTTDYY